MSTQLGTPVRYLIVDDEAPGRDNLRLAMGAHPAWHLAGVADSVAAARSMLAGVDVIFLDVQMPGESGLVLARELAALPEPPLIVFVTAWSVHAVDAFDVHALDYLLKPVDDARLAQAVARAAAMLQHRQRAAYAAAVRDYTTASAGQFAQRISVRSVGRIEQIRVDEILWLEAAGNYVELRLVARSVLHRVTLSRLETLLDPAQFLRVHRSAIVRRDQVASLATRGDGSWQLSLRCGAVVAVSERYLAALRSII
jgi:two-component system LytT family response regulator